MVQEVWLVKLENGRLNLPAGVVAALPWLAQRQTAWLLALGARRFRLLSGEGVNSSPTTCNLVASLGEVENSGTGDPLEAMPPELAVLPLRLSEVQLTPQAAIGWRFGIPRALTALAGVGPSDQVYLFIIQGYLEVWTLEMARNALDMK
jgi:hypothetical protein